MFFYLSLNFQNRFFLLDIPNRILYAFLIYDMLVAYPSIFTILRLTIPMTFSENTNYDDPANSLLIKSNITPKCASKS